MAQPIRDTEPDLGPDQITMVDTALAEAKAGPEPLPEHTGSLQAKTVKGLQWSTASTLINAVMQIGYAAIVARLVVPELFGIVAACSTVMRFGTYFSEMGLGKAIIQKKELTTQDIRAGMTGAIGLGLLFAILFYILAPVLAPLLLPDPRLVEVLRVNSAFFVLAGFASVPLNLLRRRLDFTTLAKIEVVAYVVGYGGVGLYLAYIGQGLYGLILSGLVQTLVQGVLALIITRPSLRPIFSSDAYRPLLAYGSKVSAISFLEFFSANLDTFFIGRQLGARSLGFYSRAFMLVQLPVLNLTMAVSRVLFPALSSIQHDIPRMRRIYLEAVSLVGFLIIPMGVGLSIAGPEVVGTLLGPQWTAAVPILQVLALVVPFKLLMNFGGIICDATGKLSVKIYVEISYIIIMAAVLTALGKEAGLVSYAWAILVGELIKKVVYAVVLQRILGYRIWADLVMGYVPALSTALLVGGAIALVRAVLPGSVLALPFLALCLEGAAGGVGLLIGMLLPTGRPVLRQVYGRFLSKSSLRRLGWLARLAAIPAVV